MPSDDKKRLHYGLGPTNYEDLDPYLNVDEFNRNKTQVALAKLVPKDKRYKKRINLKNSTYSFFLSYKNLQHSPIFIGSLGSFVFILFLIVIPVSGLISIPYPLSNTQAIQSSGQQIFEPINSAYYTSDYLWKGNTIDFSTSSNSSVSIAIVNSSLDHIAHSTNRTNGSFSTSVKVNKYTQKNTTFFLFKGDTVHLQVSVKLPTTFHPSSSQNSLGLIITNQKGFYSSMEFNNGLNNVSFTSPSTDLWQFNYFNYFTGLQAYSQFNVSGSYNISSFNFSKEKSIFLNQTTNSNNVFQINSSGIYTFIIFAKNTNINTSTLVNYTVVFHSGVDSIEAWKKIDPILNVLAFFLFLSLLLSVIFRILYKYDKDPSKRELTTSQKQDTIYDEEIGKKTNQPNICQKCGTENTSSDKFCVSCGFKL